MIRVPYNKYYQLLHGCIPHVAKYLELEDVWICLKCKEKFGGYQWGRDPVTCEPNMVQANSYIGNIEMKSWEKSK